jgi:MazG family protein
MSGIERLAEVIARLRGPDGCPWDRTQTLQTLAPSLLEEAHEAVSALRTGDTDAIQTELGDLTFVVFLLAHILEEQGGASIGEIAEAAAHKMITRHPHVFGSDAVAPDWEAQKLSTEPERTSRLDGVPETLPALQRAQRISQRAATLGFDWPDAEGVRAKVDEELAELDEVRDGPSERQKEEFGDLLFTMANLGRKLNLSTEDALHEATDKFERRFRQLEKELGPSPSGTPNPEPAELNRLWELVKTREQTCSD